jgi:hypothetical protein
VRAARRAPLAELRAIELDENTEREDLDTFEASKEKLAAILQVEARLKAKAGLLSSAGRREKKPRKHRGTGEPKTWERR